MRRFEKLLGIFAVAAVLVLVFSSCDTGGGGGGGRPSGIIPKTDGIKVTITGLPEEFSGKYIFLQGSKPNPFQDSTKQEIRFGYSLISGNSITVEFRNYDYSASHGLFSDLVDIGPFSGQFESILTFGIDEDIQEAWMISNGASLSQENRYCYTNGSDEKYDILANLPKIKLSSDNVTTIDFSKFRTNVLAIEEEEDD
jgi:hypothetical protein